MRSSKFPLSQKYKDFINSTRNVTADFLEGTTASGKTTVGAGVKFMRMVSASDKKLHISRVETVGKASSYGVMSIETQVEELWGSSKEDDWKANEVKRIQVEKGMMNAEPTGVGDEYADI